MDKALRYLGAVVAVCAVALLWAFLWSFIVAWAWNISMPHISNGWLPRVDYWQAYGLSLVCGLFKSTSVDTKGG